MSSKQKTAKTRKKLLMQAAVTEAGYFVTPTKQRTWSWSNQRYPTEYLPLQNISPTLPSYCCHAIKVMHVTIRAQTVAHCCQDLMKNRNQCCLCAFSALKENIFAMPINLHHKENQATMPTQSAFCRRSDPCPNACYFRSGSLCLPVATHHVHIRSTRNFAQLNAKCRNRDNSWKNILRWHE